MQNRTPGGDTGLRAGRAGAGPPAPGPELKPRVGTRGGAGAPILTPAGGRVPAPVSQTRSEAESRAPPLGTRRGAAFKAQVCPGDRRASWRPPAPPRHPGDGQRSREDGGEARGRPVCPPGPCAGRSGRAGPGGVGAGRGSPGAVGVPGGVGEPGGCGGPGGVGEPGGRRGTRAGRDLTAEGRCEHRGHAHRRRGHQHFLRPALVLEGSRVPG